MAYSVDETPVVVPDLVGGNTWTKDIYFNGLSGNSSLKAIGIDDEGYPITTYTSYVNTDSTTTSNNTRYTSITKRSTGPAVLIVSPINSVNESDSAGSPAGLGVAGSLWGDAVYDVLWNDIVDCVEVPEETNLEYGYCYAFDGTSYLKTSKYADPQYFAIHSDSYGFSLGLKENKKQLKACIAGFVLAHVDKEYPAGTPLTCTENGYLTEFKEKDMKKYPWLLVGTFWKPEGSYIWGSAVRDIEVNGRMWIKVR